MPSVDDERMKQRGFPGIARHGTFVSCVASFIPPHAGAWGWAPKRSAMRWNRCGFHLIALHQARWVFYALNRRTFAASFERLPSPARPSNLRHLTSPDSRDPPAPKKPGLLDRLWRRLRRPRRQSASGKL